MAKKDMIVVGLSGMSGAGKTTASTLFKRKGFSIINCDTIAFDIVKPETKCFKEIVEFFGENILLPSGDLNRKSISSLIFSSSEIKNKYENIIYPYIIYQVIKGIIISEQDVLLDAPTLFESKVSDLCNCVVSVVSNEKNARTRITKRDNISEHDAHKRISSQYDYDFFLANSDFLIENNEDIFSFKKQVENIIYKIRGIYGNKNTRVWRNHI